jgi:hypothetical protein
MEPEVLQSCHKSLPHVPIERHMNPNYTLAPDVLNIHLSIFLVILVFKIVTPFRDISSL